MCTLVSKNTCVTYIPAHALVPRTPVPNRTQHSLQKNGHIYTYIHTYAYAYICTQKHMRIHDTAQHAEVPLVRLSIYAQIYIHILIHMYIHAYIYIHTCTCIYIQIHMSVRTHTYTYTHTHKQHVRKHARLERRCGSLCARSPTWRQEAPHFSLVQRNQPYSTRPTLGLHCTHFLRPQYPSTPPPLFPIYPRTVHGPRQAWFYCPTLIVVQSAHHALPHSAPSQLWWSSVQLYNGPLRSCKKIRGKAAMQQSPSRRARKNPSPRCRMWLSRATRGQWKTTKTLQQLITQSRQRGAQTTSAHLNWCGPNPSGPWPAPVANHGGHAPKGFTFSPFWRAFSWKCVRLTHSETEFLLCLYYNMDHRTN